MHRGRRHCSDADEGEGTAQQKTKRVAKPRVGKKQSVKESNGRRPLKGLENGAKGKVEKGLRLG